MYQIAIVVFIVLLVFGEGKLPGIMGGWAEGIKSFKKSINDEYASEDKTTKQSMEPLSCWILVG